MKEILNAIQNNETELLGEGEWIKNSVYHVHKYNDKFYAVIVYDQMNKELMEDTLIEIKESEISDYI